MRLMDLSSWHGILLTVGALAFVTLIGVSNRLLIMMTIQQRRERMDRQIHERLRTLIGAYRRWAAHSPETLPSIPHTCVTFDGPVRGPRMYLIKQLTCRQKRWLRTARGAFAMPLKRLCPMFCS